MESSTTEERARKRLRTSHACDICRARKIRCDGNTPCTACLQAESECSYGSEANSRGKTDLILERVIRMEGLLQDMNSALTQVSHNISSPLDRQRHTLLSPALGSVRSVGRSSFSSPVDTHPGTVPHPRPRTPLSEPHNPDNLENAILDSWHTSTTESVLNWPHFDVFPALREDYTPIFELEQSRARIRTRTAIMYPYVTVEDVDGILDSFSHTVNFWYPTMSQAQLEQLRTIVNAGAFDEDGCSACLALLTMALGCASEVISGLAAGTSMLTDEETKRRLSKRAMGDTYFDSAVKKLYMAHTDVSASATHCLFFAALYFAFLRRPLQAWEYIHAAAAKCLLLLSYSHQDGISEDDERIRRIFWSCYVLESDYLAELSSLPLSGIARIESSIPLPGNYHTHATPQEEEQSSMYFLACISMRRLLNRVHQLLYARGTGASLDNARFPYVVAELDHQLDEWRDVLPAAFAFTIGYDCAPTATEHGGFLRQRYLTCRSVIYRPYLMWMLSKLGAAGESLGDGPAGPDVLKNCQACLDACLLHILNLRGFAHTVLVDTWICSLSSLAGKVVLITGASKGIGKATALLAANQGASVVINYHSDKSSADALVSQIGPDRALAVQADASTLEGIETLVSAAVKKFNKIDVVIPNAGVMPMAPLTAITPTSFDTIMSLNVKGPLFLIQSALPHIPSGGRIIFLSTGITSATGVSPAYLLYAASKGAVEQLTRVLSKDLASKNITVNAVAPGPTGTDLFFEGKPDGLVKMLEGQSPFNRLGTPGEIAEVICFLAGEGSRWVSGQVVRVNGANMV